MKNIRTANYSPLGLQKAAYSQALQSILDRTRQFFPRSYFGIALVSKCRACSLWEPIRSAQREIALSNDNTFISADSDMIFDDKLRHDGIHFSKEGAQELADQYFSSISALIKY